MSACISYQLMAYLWPFRIRRVLQNSFRRELHCWGLRYWVISALGWDALYSEALCCVISAVIDFCLNPSFLPPSSRESNWWYEFPGEETETVTLSQGSQGSGSGRKKNFQSSKFARDFYQKISEVSEIMVCGKIYLLQQDSEGSLLKVSEKVVGG